HESRRVARELLRFCSMPSRTFVIASGTYLAASLGLAMWLLPTGREEPPGFAPARHDREWPVDPIRASTIRRDALRRAAVWSPADVRAADLSANAPDATGAL